MRTWIDSLTNRFVSGRAGVPRAAWVASYMSRIVIIGGHGKVALHLARILKERGNEVTSIIRNPDHTADVSASGAHPVVADIETPRDRRIGQASRRTRRSRVLRRRRRWQSGTHLRRRPRRRDPRNRCCAARPVSRRFVMVSYFGAGLDHGVVQDNLFFPLCRGESSRRCPPSRQRPGLDCAGARPPHARASDRPDRDGRQPRRRRVECIAEEKDA